MSAIPPTLTKNPNFFIYRFDVMQLGDVSDSLQGEAATRSIQVFGTFGASGALLIEGSNDGGETWAMLPDMNGAALSFTESGIKLFNAPVGKIRARVSAGDVDTALTVLFQS